MSTKTAKTPSTYYYHFNLQNQPKDPLERFHPLSDALMEATPESFLRHYQYKPIPGGSEALAYYHSDQCDAAYLVIALVEGADSQYRLVFHCHDDKSFVAWRQRFEPYMHRILDMPGILPEQPRELSATHEIIHLDPVRVKQMGGWY